MRLNFPIILAAALVVVFILAPLLVIVGASFTTTPYIRFPPEGFTLQWYERLLQRSDFFESFLHSIVIAAACTAIATPLGALAAIDIHRISGRPREWLYSFVMAPLVLPTVVTGVALLQFYQVAYFDWTLAGLVLGHVIITIPYVVRSVGAGLFGIDPAIEEAAASLGASGRRVVLKILLPNLSPALLVSIIFVFIVSFDQVTVSIFLSGPDVTPLPIRIFSYVEYSADPMIAAVSALLIVFAYALVWALERSFGLDRVFGGGSR